MGILRIYGTISLSQFWPNGDSDADTTKVEITVKVNKKSFEYSEDGKTFRQTNAFEGAVSKGQGSKEVIKTYKKDGHRAITVRLQGVDAPELHYTAAPLKKKPEITEAIRTKYNTLNKVDRRQHYAESLHRGAGQMLTAFADKNKTVKAIVTTTVDHPFEAVDTYGRFIGNIQVGKDRDVNLWLVANGWGLPTFYTSMKPSEINAFLKAWEKGKKIAARPSKNLTNDISVFDWNLAFRKPPVKGFKLGDDKGKILVPKIFRRQAAWMIAKKAGAISKSTSFAKYLSFSPDEMQMLDDFLENGVHAAATYKLQDFVEGTKVKLTPEQIIFKEKPGTLVKGNKKVVTW